jgi:hypothetical protein
MRHPCNLNSNWEIPLPLPPRPMLTPWRRHSLLDIFVLVEVKLFKI